MHEAIEHTKPAVLLSVSPSIYIEILREAHKHHDYACLPPLMFYMHMFFQFCMCAFDLRDYMNGTARHTLNSMYREMCVYLQNTESERDDVILAFH